MILSKDTNTVYISSLLLDDNRSKSSGIQLTEILKKHDIKTKLIKYTKDIWCRDYMPIQIEKNRFLQFRYEPTYLDGFRELQSDPEEILKINSINAKTSKINLDGGNVVNWNDRAIISDRVFDENPEYTETNKLISEIEKLLEVEIIVIPQINTDMTGHADGMVRFVNKNTLVGNDRHKEYDYWTRRMNKILKSKGLNYIDIPTYHFKDKKHPENAFGCYVNFLEVSDLIVLPIFEQSEKIDFEVLEIFKQIFPDRKIETINYNPIGLFGGLLNCTTWTVKE